MKFELLFLLIILLTALVVSAAVPVNVTWGNAAPTSGGTITSVPFPGFTDEPAQPGQVTTTTVVQGLAQIDKKLLDGIFEK